MARYVNIEEEVEIPSNVSIERDGKQFTVSGEKGKVYKDFSHAKTLTFNLVTEGDDKKLVISAPFPRTRSISMAKTTKNLIMGAIIGVTNGYTYKMKIVYSHFPITVEPPKPGSNEVLIRNFIGERAPRIALKIGDVKVETTKQEVIVSGCNKEAVGQTCANIQSKCRIRDKDKRVFQDGVYVFSKQVGNEIFWKIR